jgi:hypothetical protein
MDLLPRLTGRALKDAEHDEGISCGDAVRAWFGPWTATPSVDKIDTFGDYSE